MKDFGLILNKNHSEHRHQILFGSINCLPNDKILGKSKLNEFADDNFKMADSYPNG